MDIDRPSTENAARPLQPAQHPLQAELPDPTTSAAAFSAQANMGAGAGNAGHLSFRRQRASRACETCHARKVRCDAASLGVPCTNCVAFNIECRIPSPKRKKAGPQQTSSSATATGAKDSDRSVLSLDGRVAEPPRNYPNRSSPSGSDRDGSDRSPPREGSVAASATSGTMSTAATVSNSAMSFPQSTSVYLTSEGTLSTTFPDQQAKQKATDNGTAASILKPRFTRAPITEAGRVAYLGESSNLTLLVNDQAGSSDVVHYPLPENVRGSRARLTDLDNIEIEILHQRGAFLLPPRDLCDELIESYFQWVHPVMPVINRTLFMRQYHDVNNPPSLLLLQAILLAGSRVCRDPKLLDASGSTTAAALTFYKRAKALFDANYEDDRVTIVQSLLLMGWYWEGPEDVTKNVFYWSRVATIVAQGSGMHRSVENSQLSKADKRLWKRIWWTLFTRDRSVAVALGRPVHINLEDSDVEMLVEEDFCEDEPDQPSQYNMEPIHVQFFLQYVKLCEIMGLVLSQQYSVASKGRQKSPIDLTHSDMALADWLQNCPPIVCWNAQGRKFWSGLLFSNYYTTLCLLHRAYMPPASKSNRFQDEYAAYPSRNIAFQAAGHITSIIEYLVASDQLCYCPVFIVYSLFSALIMHVYQLRSPIPSIQQATQNNIRTCMSALKDVSNVWLVGKMVYALFESILGNKAHEERLRKVAGQRHRKMQNASQGDQQTAQQSVPPDTASHLQQQLKQQPPQQQQEQGPFQQQQSFPRKYDDMAIDFGVNTPQPQESYERSRPQTPSMASAKVEPTVTPTIAPQSLTSPPAERQATDTFLGSSDGQAGRIGGVSSRPQTRPQTPFNPSFSVPTTPPDLYLVTRNSPMLSQWESFQPDQLFPDGTGISTIFPTTMPPPVTQGLDASLMQAQQFGGGIQVESGAAGGVGLGANPSPLQNPATMPPGYQQPQGNGWQPGTNGAGGTCLDSQSPSDSWSSTSVPSQAVPSTLNVEDWLQFFGINGDQNISMDLSSMT